MGAVRVAPVSLGDPDGGGGRTLIRGSGQVVLPASDPTNGHMWPWRRGRRRLCYGPRRRRAPVTVDDQVASASRPLQDDAADPLT